MRTLFELKSNKKYCVAENCKKQYSLKSSQSTLTRHLQTCHEHLYQKILNLPKLTL